MGTERSVIVREDTLKIRCDSAEDANSFFEWLFEEGEDKYEEWKLRRSGEENGK